MPTILSILLQGMNKYSNKWLDVAPKKSGPTTHHKTNIKTNKTTTKYYKPPAGATNTMKWAKISACIDA